MQLKLPFRHLEETDPITWALFIGKSMMYGLYFLGPQLTFMVNGKLFIIEEEIPTKML
jgi:hypothetical protein